MKALILAAGFGTRLAPHTRTFPKALFPVGGIPVLGRMIALLKRAGCTAVAVNAHHLAHRIQSYLAENDFGMPVTLSHEPEILGTAGAIRHLAHYWDDDPFIVVNADIVTDIKLADVYRRHQEQKAQVTLVMHDRAPLQPGVGGRAGSNHRLPTIFLPGWPGSPAKNGLYRNPRPGCRHPPADSRQRFSDIISVYRQMLDEGVPLHAHVVRDHYWQDMGSPDRYRMRWCMPCRLGPFNRPFPTIWEWPSIATEYPAMVPIAVGFA